MKGIKTYLYGLLVGAADIVPGISGGTVAFITGIYDALLSSIASINGQVVFDLIRLRVRSALSRIQFTFLVPFLLGVMTSFLALASVIHHLLHDELYRVFIYSLFMGLVIGSTIVIARLLPAVSFRSLLWFLVGAVSAWSLTFHEPKEAGFIVPLSYVTSQMSTCRNVDTETKTLMHVTPSELAVMVANGRLSKSDQVFDSETNKASLVEEVLEKVRVPMRSVWMIVCGALAISAMLLPGISGSYILQVLGMYGIILGALVDWIQGIQSGSFDWGAFQILVSVGLGIACGAIFFSRVVRYLLAHHNVGCISCLLGFMIGALRAVWPFWSYGYVLDPTSRSFEPELFADRPVLPDVFSREFALSFALFLLGVCVVVFVEFYAKKKQQSSCYCV